MNTLTIKQQDTNGHPDYILSNIQYEDWLGILKTWNKIFSSPVKMIYPQDPKVNGRIPIRILKNPHRLQSIWSGKIVVLSSRSGLILKNLGPMRRRRRKRTDGMQKKMKNTVIWAAAVFPVAKIPGISRGRSPGGLVWRVIIKWRLRACLKFGQVNRVWVLLA